MLNREELIPAYIHIDKYTLITNYPTQGSNSHKISDVWVYVDDALIGCFELPCTFPVIAKGVHTVKIKPGIKVNGMSSERAPYPFYSAYEQSLNFIPGETATMSPTTNYLSTTTFAFKEDFESSGMTIAKTSASDTNLQILTAPYPEVFEGSKCGIAYVDASNYFFECSTINPLTLPKGGQAVFLEFNYKCNYDIAVGIFSYGSAGTDQLAVLNFYPSNDWNKAYVYLTPGLSQFYDADNYKIFWRLLNSTGDTNVKFQIDNVKVVY
jgi:hypothetical protein